MQHIPQHSHWPTDFGSKLNILRQSSMYFLQHSSPKEANVRLGLYADARKYNRLLAAEPQDSQKSILQLWQLPLGLLFALRPQRELIEHFFVQQQALPHWYENIFVPQTRSTLVLQQPFLEEPLACPVSRFSPTGKALLKFRINGFRCSATELLLFLAFSPLSLLLSSELQAVWGQTISQLDFLLFELYNERFYVEDILRKDYREGLRIFWQEHWGINVQYSP